MQLVWWLLAAWCAEVCAGAMWFCFNLQMQAMEWHCTNKRQKKQTSGERFEFNNRQSCNNVQQYANVQNLYTILIVSSLLQYNYTMTSGRLGDRWPSEKEIYLWEFYFSFLYSSASPLHFLHVELVPTHNLNWTHTVCPQDPGCTQILTMVFKQSWNLTHYSLHVLANWVEVALFTSKHY